MADLEHKVMGEWVKYFIGVRLEFVPYHQLADLILAVAWGMLCYFSQRKYGFCWSQMFYAAMAGIRIGWLVR